MQIKLKADRQADIRFVNCPITDIENGTSLFMRYSPRYGYKFLIVSHNNKYYITQALYDPMHSAEHISIHETKSINDAKAIIGAMIQFIKTYRNRPVEEADA